MNQPMDRHQFGELYHQLFKGEWSREGCRQAWARWQAVWAADFKELVLHLPEDPPPEPQPDDYWIFATTGPLRYLARCSAQLFPSLPQQWVAMAATDLLHGLGVNPRSQARAFVHNSLVDGWVADTKIAPGVACAIAWLLSLMDGMPGDLKDYHAIGYDITYVPGPAGQHSMFNFRAVFSPKMDPAVMVDTARAVPTPEWQPPPH